jgi:hypothetical protein
MSMHEYRQIHVTFSGLFSPTFFNRKSIASRITRSYPRQFTFYVARPARSILPFYFFLFPLLW